MEKGAKFTGLLTFLGGLVLLGMVFVSALRMLENSQRAPGDLKELPGALVVLVARILFLFVLGYIASAVAGRGIQLYEAAARRTDEDVVVTAKK